MSEAQVVSPLASGLASASADLYAKLVVKGGTPDAAKKRLEKIMPEQLLSVQVILRDAASAMLAGLWLWHDALDESHSISQSLHTPSGSFWHAIMHRREGDFWNSKYWYARCRNHPALAEIGSRAKPLLATLVDRPLAARFSRGGWDADAFVDWVEGVAAGNDASSKDLAVKLQKVEWRALFDCCAQEAVDGRRRGT